ncbi:hypothetical protein D3C79_728200 [compost metagenome]
MRDRAGVEACLQLVVDREQIAIGMADLVVAVYRSVGYAVGAGDQPADPGQVVFLVVESTPAQVLADRPGVVELVAELVAQRGAFDFFGVKAGFTDEAIHGHLAVRAAAVDGGPGNGGRGQGLVLLVGREHGQAGLLVRPPGQARRHVGTVVVGMVVDAIGFAAKADQAIRQGLVFVERAADVKVGLATMTATAGNGDFATLIVGRALGDRVDHAAGLVLPEEDRGRALEYLDPLHAVGLFADHAEETQGAQAQAIAVGERDGIAAQENVVGCVARTTGVGTHAGGVAQGLGQALGTEVVHALAGNDRDGLRVFQDRRIGLGAGQGAAGDIAGSFTVG